MKYKIDTLKEVLKTLLDRHPLTTEFQWSFPQNSPLAIPEDIVDNYSKNIYLKENYSDLLQDDSNFTNFYWLIKDWGGISSFKENEKNNLKIKKFIKELEEKKLTKESFSLISSFSKIASFLDYKSFVIYDSRVIYSLNWLLLKYTDTKDFFPQPNGRNKELIQYDLKTIINLLPSQYSYKSHETAYFEYCELIVNLSSELYGKDKPYKLEMLLFMLAPDVIVEDIKKTVEIKLIEERQ